MFRTHKNKTEEQDKTNMDKIKTVITGEGYTGVQCTVLALFWKADISQKVKLVKKKTKFCLNVFMPWDNIYYIKKVVIEN